MAYVATLLVALLGTASTFGICYMRQKLDVNKWPLVGKAFQKYGCYTNGLSTIILLTIVLGFMGR